MPGKPVWHTHMPGAEAFVSVQPGMPVACFLLFSERLQGLHERVSTTAVLLSLVP